MMFQDTQRAIMDLGRLLEAALEQLPEGKIRVELSEVDRTLLSSTRFSFEIKRAQHQTNPWKMVVEAYIPGMERNRPKRKFELEGS